MSGSEGENGGNRRGFEWTNNGVVTVLAAALITMVGAAAVWWAQVNGQLTSLENERQWILLWLEEKDERMETLRGRVAEMESHHRMHETNETHQFTLSGAQSSLLPWQVPVVIHGGYSRLPETQPGPLSHIQGTKVPSSEQTQPSNCDDSGCHDDFSGKNLI